MANTGQLLRILIVDDEERIADTLGAIVRNWGHEVLVEHAAKMASLVAQRFKPDVLLTDVVMPEMDGFALAEHFREHYPHCNIIFMSGNASSGPLLAMADQRGYRYVLLVKPFHPHELLAVLDKMPGSGNTFPT